MKTLRERLLHAMNETGLTNQSELSKLAGVNQSIISKILSGRNETSKYSGRLASALGISADWLINGSGSMLGDASTSLQRIDASKLVCVWDENGQTDNIISWTESIPSHFRAYILKKNSGIAQAPTGAVVLVDPTISPGNDDLVVTMIRNEISLYRYLDGGIHGFLVVDDDRIPVTEVTDPSWIIGVAEQILVRRLRK
ncbi:helix-turn-helix transcriptional regulator [Budviciaceae bacterium BWR-B9]|uniref:Helix-turn-helix transcriptional regulator n=1 Tax=Limnobaculum allomyrinae TaxID=2791986 RepID=A0ABS1IWG8_9GAMM|nr:MULTISPECIES: helix-turn-helix transcriptional regulator [Limnobaculum]MBK5146027.1 helix-turn-helix transcriptional regulator [Limnobaculum allomyrinae]MBV7694073.1 helix-turn-helix domain-containing protein [Limnobaculum sp. M2-1]